MCVFTKDGDHTVGESILSCSENDHKQWLLIDFKSTPQFVCRVDECSEAGGYLPKQCWGDICHCVNVTTGGLESLITFLNPVFIVIPRFAVFQVLC